MSKRKNRSGAPNLPRETLERARRQAAVDSGAAQVEDEADALEAAVDEPEAPVAAPAPVVRAAATPRRTAEARPPSGLTSARATSAAARRGRGVRPVSASGSRREIDGARIAAMLENPTKVVTDEQLRTEYAYVMDELRQIAIVAGALIAVLVVLAQIVPK